MAKWEVWVLGDSVNVRERIEQPGEYRVFQVCGGYNARGMALDVVQLGDLDVDAMRAALTARGRIWEDRSETLAIVLPKATIMSQGEFGMAYHVTQVRDLRVHVGPYAQYLSAVHASFVVKGQRKRRGLVQGYAPNLIVIDGWADVAVPDMFHAPVQGDGVSTQTGRGLSCSPMWGNEARSAVAASGVKVVRDFREHKASEKLAA